MAALLVAIWNGWTIFRATQVKKQYADKQQTIEHLKANVRDAVYTKN